MVKRNETLKLLANFSVIQAFIQRTFPERRISALHCCRLRKFSHKRSRQCAPHRPTTRAPIPLTHHTVVTTMTTDRPTDRSCCLPTLMFRRTHPTSDRIAAQQRTNAISSERCPNDNTAMPSKFDDQPLAPTFCHPYLLGFDTMPDFIRCTNSTLF